MDLDEIVYNRFFHSLRNEYRKKYELAVSRCWTICVPSGNSLRGLIVTENFVDDHILKPHSELPHHFISTGPTDPCLYKFNGTSLEPVENEPSSSNSGHRVRVVSVEKGYNTEFQMYVILVLDKPLLLKYSSVSGSPGDEMKLNCSITCYKEAVKFFDQLTEGARIPLDTLDSNLNKIDLDQFNSSEELSSTLQDLTRHYWAIIMRKHPLDIQRDARFQKLLSTALEVFIMHCLHGKIYSLLSGALEREDLYVSNKLAEMVDAGVTPDQLGADESLAISLPAAIVELATLDAREGPLEKLLCLKSALDLILAEVKAALADVQTKTEEDCGNDGVNATFSYPRTASRDDLIPLLLYDGLTESLATFEAAVSTLFHIQLDDLPDRSRKVKNELPIDELLDVISSSEGSSTPLDRQIHQLATMLEKCTQD